MLVELAINDFAIIRETRIAFEPGFNALTGETGAGKSILIDALGAVLGERVGSDVVRGGARAARIEATFDLAGEASRPEIVAILDEMGIEPEDDTLILAREINAGGRGTARVNGRATTAGALARLGSLLVDIHGQSDHLSLLRPAEQLDILDRFGETTGLRATVAGRVDELRALRRRIAGIATGARERAQRVDLLRFQVEEIAAAALEPDEEERLLVERRVLASAERLATDSALAQRLVSGDDAFGDAAPAALPALRQASDLLAGLAETDPAAGEINDRLAESLYLLEDVNADLRAYREAIEIDPARLAQVEDRLDLVKSLKRKYGATIPEILATAEAARAELENLTGEAVDSDVLTERERVLASDVGSLAADLSGRRTRAGERLAREIERAIAELNMGRANVAVRVEQHDDPDGVPFDERRVAVDATGADHVAFLMAPNAGETLKPLARVASGGETARLMLAIKSILSAADATPTLVFDEVDVGVGSRSGQVVGEKLWGLTGNHQVVVITHLAQIAAFAATHFRIAKADEDDRVVSRVELVEDEHRVDELAAMLDGEPVTPASRANATALLDRVDRWKANHTGAHRPVAAGRP